MSGSSQQQKNVTLTISPDTGLELSLDSMEAVEELGRPFLITLDVSSAKPKGDLHTLLGASATIKLAHPTKPVRYFNGVVSRFHYRGLVGGGYRYRVELRPWIWLLSHEQDCRIFSAKSPWTIMTELFRAAGFTDFADKRQNAAGDAVLDHCVQYRETTLAFVTRLMEEFGLYYFVTHADGTHTINFADDPNSHASIGEALPYQYDATDWREAEDHVWDWNADASIQPGGVSFQEYNFTTPKADLAAKSLTPGGHTHGSGEVYGYPGRYETAADGQKAARVRMQDFATRRQVHGGTSNTRKLGAGSKFTLSDFPDASANQEYLVIGSVCSVDRAETRPGKSEEDIIDTFRVAFRAVPGTRPFQLPNETPRPLIPGPQTAKVVGEAGEEVTTDQYGRVKVKFPWDRRTPENETSSCWIRVAQVWAGKTWGGMVIPRIGQEVIVEFLEGNPDRPLVTGTVFNADQTVPYALPANKTRSTFKTNSSKGGGGFNELRFEDKKGEEEVFFQAQKDFNEVILNSHTAKITQDTTTTVEKGNRSYTISKGDDTHKVTTGKRTTTIKGDDATTVETGDHKTTVSTGDHATTVSTGNHETTVSTGNHTTKVSLGNHTTTVSVGNHEVKVSVGSSSIDALTSVKLSSGPSSIELSPDGITIKGLMVTVQGTTMASLKSPMTTVNGDATLILKGGVVMIN